MNSMTHFYSLMVRSLDIPLGGLLSLPRDLALLLFATGTALLMVLVRRAVTNQDLLRRCDQDLRQLKRLLRSAKQLRDKPRRQRLRNTVALIKGMQFTADLKVLAVVIVPVGALACWATERFDYLLPHVGEELVVRAYYPLSSVGEVTHFVPTSGIELKSPAIQQVVLADGASPAFGVAQWTFQSTRSFEEAVLVIRHHGESAVHRIAIGQPFYLSPEQHYSNERLSRTEVLLQRYQPLALDLKTDAVGLPPWMIGYLALTLLLVPALKRLMRVF